MVSKVQSLKLDTSVWSNEIVQVRYNPGSGLQGGPGPLTHQGINCTHRLDRQAGNKVKQAEHSETHGWTGESLKRRV